MPCNNFEHKESTEDYIFDFQAVFDPNNYLYFYSERLTEERTSKEVDFLLKILPLDISKRILDLACGHGRHANQLAKLGNSVVGLDNNEAFLDIARCNAKENGINIEYACKDMRQISYYEEFDIILLLFTVFGYFNDEENKNVLKNISAALKFGGLLCLDLTNRDTFLKDFPSYSVVEKEGNLMIDRFSFDISTGRMLNKRIYLRDSKRTDAPYSIRLYNFTEIRHLLDTVGLSIEAVYGEWDASPLMSTSRRMIIVARKS